MRECGSFVQKVMGDDIARTGCFQANNLLLRLFNHCRWKKGIKSAYNSNEVPKVLHHLVALLQTDALSPRRLFSNIATHNPRI